MCILYIFCILNQTNFADLLPAIRVVLGINQCQIDYSKPSSLPLAIKQIKIIVQCIHKVRFRTDFEDHHSPDSGVALRISNTTQSWKKLLFAKTKSRGPTLYKTILGGRRTDRSAGVFFTAVLTKWGKKYDQMGKNKIKQSAKKFTSNWLQYPYCRLDKTVYARNLVLYHNSKTTLRNFQKFNQDWHLSKFSTKKIYQKYRKYWPETDDNNTNNKSHHSTRNNNYNHNNNNSHHSTTRNDNTNNNSHHSTTRNNNTNNKSHHSTTRNNTNNNSHRSTTRNNTNNKSHRSTTKRNKSNTTPNSKRSKSNTTPNSKRIKSNTYKTHIKIEKEWGTKHKSTKRKISNASDTQPYKKRKLNSC